ncbi:molybdopterin-dependent oxidoreductase [Streptomyces sp. NPDC008222]|uniref:molybdopterin-dependent oxidoreductase n=1 Tax=Streptomyces sp. NPDC008222 TaxID=3364820 RepID=UPI0036DFE780
MSAISRGFHGRRSAPAGTEGRVPPGQHLTDGFPVLTSGPTQHTPLDQWTFSIRRDGKELASWSWPEIQALPAETITADIHCVTRWSKLDTQWRGVRMDTLLAAVDSDRGYAMAFCDGGYTTNLPIRDLTNGRAWLAYEYDGALLEPEHGGPARLLVPHLYLWKSAKWVRGVELLEHNKAGFWETYGYHIYGDPWKEQRYSND